MIGAGGGYRRAMRFPFAFDYPIAAPLAAVGVLPATAHVDVDDEWFAVRFGPWRLRTPVGNLGAAHLTGPYNAFRVLGTHISFADRGVTFGTNTRQGLCVAFHEPVSAALPGGLLRHPAATVTVAEPERLRAQIARASA
jgi:hypothetical protein